eukprot:Skav236060  [mRNA]  locus=scaffold2566:147486:150447:+ [translate_table: standard]
MLEAMMNDLGLNSRSASAPISAMPTTQATSEGLECPAVEEPDTDDEVVQEALEEQGLAEEAAEQDIQQLLHEPPNLLLSSPLTPAPATQQKTSTSRNILTSSRAETPCSGAQTFGSTTTRAASSSPPLEAQLSLTISHEASANETLFLQLLEDEVGGNLNLCLPGTAETSGATSPLSSLPSP